MAIYEKIYDVIVVGAGHAGCEAALAAARMGCTTLMMAIDLDKVAAMPCSPSVGGMAKVTDKTAIQYKTLNTKKVRRFIRPELRMTRICITG